MSSIKLHNDGMSTATFVSNDFIDYYMTSANGEFVKVYIYLLRCMNVKDGSFSISKAADKFEYTEKDIQRALKYWEKMKLLRLEYDEDKRISGIYFLDSESEKDADIQNNSAYTKRRQQSLPVQNTLQATAEKMKQEMAKNVVPSAVQADITSKTESAGLEILPVQEGESLKEKERRDRGVFPQKAEDLQEKGAFPQKDDTLPKEAKVPEKPAYSREQLEGFREKAEIAELLFITEKYLGRTLSSTDINTIFYWYDSLCFSVDLIEYLIEYCVGKSHTSMQYMGSVALGWKKAGISSVEQAKRTGSMYGKAHYAVMKALGIRGRNLVPNEIEFIDKWTKEYAFTIDIMKEACARTILTTHQPSFEYADRILANWSKEGIRHLTDVAKLDESFQKAKDAAALRKVSVPQKTRTATPNKFNNFSQRTYDFDHLEKQLLK
ncbi:DnaD domain protein [Lachnospiraceae bacterium ZAX-1]